MNRKEYWKNKRTPQEQEIMKKGLICDGKPLPKMKKIKMVVLFK